MSAENIDIKRVSYDRWDDDHGYLCLVGFWLYRLRYHPTLQTCQYDRTQCYRIAGNVQFGVRGMGVLDSYQEKIKYWRR